MLVGVGVTAIVFVMAALASASDTVHPFVEGTGGVRNRPRTGPVSTVPEEGLPPELEESAQGPGDGSFFELIVRLTLVVAILLGAAIVLKTILRVLRELQFNRRARRPEVRWDLAEPTGHEEFAEVVDDGLRALETGPVADAIIACWIKLEEAAAAAGVARDPSETATELTARVLHHHDVSFDAIDTLLGLYREARFSEHGMGGGARAVAQTALARVRADLSVSPSASKVAAP
ncbi:hypothetical protein BH20ACT4_BH20ACT4_14750 [soil metagenome]